MGDRKRFGVSLVGLCLFRDLSRFDLFACFLTCRLWLQFTGGEVALYLVNVY